MTHSDKNRHVRIQSFSNQLIEKERKRERALLTLSHCLIIYIDSGKCVHKTEKYPPTAAGEKYETIPAMREKREKKEEEEKGPQIGDDY